MARAMIVLITRSSVPMFFVICVRSVSECRMRFSDATAVPGLFRLELSRDPTSTRLRRNSIASDASQFLDVQDAAVTQSSLPESVAKRDTARAAVVGIGENLQPAEAQLF